MADVALVAGAAQGLGEAVARALHGAGYRVALADVNEDAARSLAHALNPAGDTACALALDVRAKTAFETALAQLVQRWGGVQVLVNNAAVTPTTPVMEITQEEFDAVLAVNLRGTFLGCQVFGAYFRAQGYGRIVNVASLAGQNGGTATGAHYAASKGGVIALTKVFAREFAASGVTVNAVAPGPLDVPSRREKISTERIAAIEPMITVQRLGDPGFVAATIVHLASRLSGFTTGATWDLNGGLLMR